MGLSKEQIEQLRDVDREPEVTMCMHDIMCAIPIDQTFDVPWFRVRALGHMIMLDDTSVDESTQDHRLIVVEMCMDEARLAAIVAELSTAHLAHISGNPNGGQ